MPGSSRTATRGGSADKRERVPGRGSSRSVGAAGAFVAAIGAIGLICVYLESTGSGQSAGTIGAPIARALRWAGGGWAALIPAALVAAGVHLAFERPLRTSAGRLVGLAALTLGLLGLARSGAAGSAAHGWLAWALGGAGATAAFAVIVLVGVSLVTNVSLPSLTVAIVRVIAKAARLAARGTVLLARGLSFLARRVLLPMFEEPEGAGDEHVQGPRAGDAEPAASAEALLSRPRRARRPADRRGLQPEPTAAAGAPDVAQAGTPVPTSAGQYVLPPITLLGYPVRPARSRQADQPDHSKLLEETLASFGVKGRVTQVDRGPVVTRYELAPAPGIKVSKIMSLADDLALALASSGVRLEAPIPGKSAIGIEVPNQEISFVYLREVLQSSEFQRHRGKLAIAMGKDIAGKPVVADLESMLHLLVAGATGSGKSVCLNALIASILFKATPDEVKFLMIDPKRVELTTYDGIPHLLAPVVTDTREAGGYLRWVAQEMDDRYKLLGANGVRNIERYNSLCRAGKLADDEARPLPYIVVIIDELGDLMMVAQKDVEDVVSQLAFMARAAGIHLVLATQRPSADVVTGIIKMNIPSRVAFAVPSQVDSRVILDTGGAERLLGRGDMLFYPVGAPKPLRVQGAFVSDSEIETIVDFVKSQAEPTYVAESITRQSPDGESLGEEDPLFEDAVRLILETQEASISKLQRRFRIGYTRAARLIDAMESRGMVGPYEGSKPRRVLMTLEKWDAARARARE